MITRNSRGRFAARRSLRTLPTPEESGVWVEENWAELQEELGETLENLTEAVEELLYNSEGWENNSYIFENVKFAQKYLRSLDALLERAKGAYTLNLKRTRRR